MRINISVSQPSILSDAFTGQAVAGGALGMVIVTGVRRAAFSNEAGMVWKRWHMVLPRPRADP